MKEAIRRRARELGFDDCRVTTAEPPASAAVFQRWLAEGRHGEMAYLARNAHKRVEPRQVLPGAKSILALAVSYHGAAGPGPSAPSADHVEGPGALAPEGRTDGSQPRGVVARYARYRDYHDVMGERLKELTRFVNQLGGAGTKSRWYVDTGPLLERDLAQRAGLGFIGKHTNLISRQFGNWIFLASLVTTLELEPDPPEKNRCGSCTRCLEACPTAAITAPFQLDARRCISYLTIELKGAIPLELRPAIGNRIFGCDECLAVCPWNRFARAGHLMKAHARSDLAVPELLGLLRLAEEEFQRRFAGTPLARAKRRGLLRNVCIALGNLGDERVIPALEKTAAEAEPLIAEHAAWALAQVRAREVQRPKN